MFIQPLFPRMEKKTGALLNLIENTEKTSTN
jgi:hypothetical protein